MDRIHIAILILLGLIVVTSTLSAVYSGMLVFGKKPYGGSEPASAYARAASYTETVAADLRSQGARSRDTRDNQGRCATMCGEACMGRSDVPISEHCARKCAAACGFDFK